MKNYLPILALAVLWGTPTAAKASTITLTGLGYYDVIPLIVHTNTAESGIAGQIAITVDGTNLIAYCVDLFTNIGFSTYNTSFGDPAGYTNGQRAAWIYENYNPGVNTNEAGAALQLALWDVVHDGGDGLSTGNVQLDPAGSATLRASAEAIIAASLNQSSNNGTILYNVSFDGQPAQNFITSQLIPISALPTPEPGTWAMTMVGIGLSVFGRLRKK